MAMAMITWLSKENGGRKEKPKVKIGERYLGAIHFPDVETWPPPTMWSIQVNKRGISDSDPMVWLTELKFVMEEAPYDNLSEGARVQLYEGARLVAEGYVVKSLS